MPLFGPPDIEKLRAKSRIKGLVNALRYKKDRHVREAAARALEQLGWQPDKSKAGASYWMAINRWDRCIEIGGPAVNLFIVALNDESHTVRAGAAEALGKIGDKRAVGPLIAALKDEAVRRAAVEALGKIGSTRAVGLLIDAVKDGNKEVRRAAISALGNIGHKRAIEPLIAALRDKDLAVRRAAALVLLSMYRSVGLADRYKRLILTERWWITDRHHDTTFSEHSDHRSYSDCWAHADSYSPSHHDQGIGINFPI